jgi:hypothetical protein
MTLALRSPAMVKDIVSVDNAPIDAVLSTDFAKYVRGMKKIEDAGVTTQKAADAILAEYEEVCPSDASEKPCRTHMSRSR